VTNVAYAPAAPYGRPHLDPSRPVPDRDTVKVESLAPVTHDGAVAAPLVEGRNDAAHDHGDPSEPWRTTLAISMALSAASRPLLVSSGRERSRACSRLSVVSTPKLTGTRVLS